MHLLIIKVHAFRAWFTDTMQSAADIVCRHCFLATILVMTVTKVRYWHLFTTTRLYSFVLHNSYDIVQLIYDQIRMVESIDGSRLKVTLSINRPNVRAN